MVILSGNSIIHIIIEIFTIFTFLQTINERCHMIQIHGIFILIKQETITLFILSLLLS